MLVIEQKQLKLEKEKGSILPFFNILKVTKKYALIMSKLMFHSVNIDIN